MRKLLYVCILCILGNSYLAAQDPEKEFNDFMNSIEKEFDESVRNYQTELKDFTDSINAGYLKMLKEYEIEFREFLKEEWNTYHLEEAFETDTASGSESSSTTAYEIDDYGLYFPVALSEEDSDFPKQAFNFSFFGEELSISYDTKFGNKITEKPDNKTVTDVWNGFNQCHFNHLLQQFQELRSELRLNDWGYYILIKEFAEQLYGRQNNNSVTLTWFLLLKSSYMARIAYYSDQYILLLPVMQKIYDQKTIKLGNYTYYAFDFSGDSLYTYPKEYPGPTRLLDLTMSDPINFGGEERSRSVQFDNNRKYKFEFVYNKDLVDFYQTIPHTELAIYLNAPFSEQARESLIDQLAPLLDTMSTERQVQFLLKMIQESFKYISDNQQFNFEKPFFPEESLHFPFSDCEDRALFLSRLMYDLLGKESILVSYPGHVVTAIELPGFIEGSSLNYNGKKWILCDPSYEGAPPGEIISGYIHQNSQVTEIIHRNYLARGQDPIIDLELSDTIAQFQGCQLLGTYDKESITQFTDRQGYSYLAGIYYDSVMLGDQILRNSQNSPGYFIVKSDSATNVVWMTEIPLNKLAPLFDIPFTAIIDSTGLLNCLNINSSDLWHETSQAWTDDLNNTLFSGLYIQSKLMDADSLWFEEGGKYDIVSRFMRDYKSIEKSGSGKFNAFAWSLLRLLRNNGIFITGEQLSTLFDEAGLQSTHSLKEVRNLEGVVRLETIGSIDIQIADKVLLKNFAKCRILCFPDNMKLEVLEGVYRGNDLHLDPIHSIDIKKNDEQIEFDYSHHYQKKLTMKADIL